MQERYSHVAELSEEQKVTKLQQQLLLLLARQAKDLTAAYPQMSEDATAKEAVFGIFTSEMDKLSTEVNLLSSAVYVPARHHWLFCKILLNKELRLKQKRRRLRFAGLGTLIQQMQKTLGILPLYACHMR